MLPSIEGIASKKIISISWISQEVSGYRDFIFDAVNILLIILGLLTELHALYIYQ